MIKMKMMIRHRCIRHFIKSSILVGQSLSKSTEALLKITSASCLTQKR
jgi:hypothetical protein